MEPHEIAIFALLVMLIIAVAVLIMLLGWIALEKFIDWRDRKYEEAIKERETKRQDALFKTWATECKL